MLDAERKGEERAAGFVLFRTESSTREYLVLRHRGQEYWAFPKGRVDPGESELQAAIREVMEETGVAPGAQVVGFRAQCQYSMARGGRRHNKIVTFFLAEARPTTIRLSGEHDDARWLPYSDARDVLTYDESRRVLDEAEAILSAAAERPGTRESMDRATVYATRREEENACVLSYANLSIKRFFALDHAVYQEGALSAKVKELLGLATSTVLRCNDCISYHVAQAVGQGATDEEIVETLGVALIVGGSITIPHLRHAMRFLQTVERSSVSPDGRGHPSTARSEEDE